MTKPSRFGQGTGKNARYGQGVQLGPRTPDVPVAFGDFSGGYNSSHGREGAPPNASPDAIDFEVNDKNQLVRMNGTTAPVTLDHSPYQMFTQAGLDGIFEILFFDAPYLGVMKGGHLDWTDIGLVASPRPFAIGQYADTVYFSNLTGPTFKREPNKAPVAVPSVPAARSYDTFAARLYAAGTNVDGAFQPMGVRWSAANGDPDDFDSDGSGSELLVAATSDGEHAVAVRGMSLDLVAIICSGSVWIGRRTGDTFRPAAFEPRTQGVGGLTDRTVATTPLGVAFLSRDGLQIFDGNGLTMISAAINAELLSLDLEQINLYRVTYDPIKNWIELLTPACRWIYDVAHSRWYRSSIIASDAALYVAETTGTTWAELGVAWNGYNTSSWADLDPVVLGELDRYWLKPIVGVASQYAIENEASTSQFGLQILARWQTSRQLGQNLRSLQTVKNIAIEYSGSGVVEFWLPSSDGQSELARVDRLYSSATLRSKGIPLSHTGRGVDLEFRVRSGKPVVSMIQLVAEPRSTLIVVTETSDSSIPPSPPQYLDPVVGGYTRISTGLLTREYILRVQRLYDNASGGPDIEPQPSLYVQGSASGATGGQSSAGPAFTPGPVTDEFGNPGFSYTSMGSFIGGGQDIAQVFGVGGGPQFGYPSNHGYQFRLEYYQGVVNAWVNNNQIQHYVVAVPDPNLRLLPSGAIFPNGNPTTGPFKVNKSGLVSFITTRRYYQEVVGGLANGSVVTTVAGLAAVTTNLDAAGNGVIAVPDATLWPASVTYRFYTGLNGTGVLKAQLTIPEAWGGDILGYVAQLDVP